MSSESIERFDPEVCEARDEGAPLIAIMAPANSTGRQGLWVRYSDHERIVKELEARLRLAHDSCIRATPTFADALRVVNDCEYENVAVHVLQQRLRAMQSEPPPPSLSDAIKEVERLRDENNRNYEYWKSISSNPDTDFGVLKWAAWRGEDERVITALKSLGPQRED
jgi:hypothetical protein